jgi:hypothetical protein
MAGTGMNFSSPASDLRAPSGSPYGRLRRRFEKTFRHVSRIKRNEARRPTRTSTDDFKNVEFEILFEAPPHPRDKLETVLLSCDVFSDFRSIIKLSHNRTFFHPPMIVTSTSSHLVPHFIEAAKSIALSLREKPSQLLLIVLFTESD